MKSFNSSLPDLSEHRLTQLTDHGTIRYLTPVHDEDIANVNKLVTHHYRSGVRAGLIVGFVVAAIVMYVMLLVTS